MASIILYFIFRNYSITLMMPERQRKRKNYERGIIQGEKKPVSPCGNQHRLWGKIPASKTYSVGVGGPSTHLFLSHSSGFPGLVPIWNTHIHQDWESCTGNHSEFLAFVTNFQVDDNNPLLLHQVSLPELPGEYVATVAGDRCVYLQVRLQLCWKF